MWTKLQHIRSVDFSQPYKQPYKTIYQTLDWWLGLGSKFCLSFVYVIHDSYFGRNYEDFSWVFFFVKKFQLSHTFLKKQFENLFGIIFRESVTKSPTSLFREIPRTESQFFHRFQERFLANWLWKGQKKYACQYLLPIFALNLCWDQKSTNWPSALRMISFFLDVPEELSVGNYGC